MKKLIALMLSLLMVILIFGSCDTSVEEESKAPVSEVSSVEVSSEKNTSSTSDNRRDPASESSSFYHDLGSYYSYPEPENGFYEGSGRDVRNPLTFAESWEEYELGQDEWSLVEEFLDVYRCVDPSFAPFAHITHLDARRVMSFVSGWSYIKGGSLPYDGMTKEVVMQVMQRFFADIPDNWIFELGDPDYSQYHEDEQKYYPKRSSFKLDGFDRRVPTLVAAYQNSDNQILLKIKYACHDYETDYYKEVYPETMLRIYLVQEDGIWKIARMDDTAGWLKEATYDTYAEKYVLPLSNWDSEFHHINRYLSGSLEQTALPISMVFLRLNAAFNFYDGENLWALDEPYVDKNGAKLYYFIPYDTVFETLQTYLNADCSFALQKDADYNADAHGFYFLTLGEYQSQQTFKQIEYVRRTENGLEICAFFENKKTGDEYYVAYVMDEFEDGTFVIYSMDIRATVYAIKYS